MVAEDGTKDAWGWGEKSPTQEEHHVCTQQSSVSQLFSYAVTGCEIENCRNRLSRNFPVQRRVLVCMSLSSGLLRHT